MVLSYPSTPDSLCGAHWSATPFLLNLPTRAACISQARGSPGLLGESWRREGWLCDEAFMETEHWCSRWTEGYYSSLLSSLSAFMDKICYLSALFIHHESWRPWPLITELMLIVSSTGHSWPLPPSWNSFCAWLLWCCSILIPLATALVFSVPSAGSFSS